MSSSPIWLKAGSVPSLDGLRTFSVAAVILGHLGKQRPESFFAHMPDASGSGVNVFFVISGFLITLLLIREKERTNNISLKGFYLRRAARIIPAYATFLFLLVSGRYLFETPLSVRSLLVSGTQMGGIFSPGDYDVGHTWSLSAEEHFYFVWPLLFAYLPPRLLTWGCVAFITTAPIVRVIWLFISRSFDAVSLMDPNGCSLSAGSVIACGCLLAIIAKSPPDRASWLWAMGRRPTALVFLSVVGLAAVRFWVFKPTNRLQFYYATFLEQSLESIMCTGIVWGSIQLQNDSLLGRVLNFHWIRWVGRISYGLYLWQQPFTNPTRDSWFFLFPINIIIVFLVASTSYVLIEKPFLLMKERRNRSESDNTFTLSDRKPKENSSYSTPIMEVTGDQLLCNSEDRTK